MRFCLRVMGSFRNLILKLNLQQENIKISVSAFFLIKFVFQVPDWKNNSKQEKKMGPQLEAPLKLLEIILLWWSEGFQGALNWTPLMPRDASLSNSYTSNRCCSPGPELEELHASRCLDEMQNIFFLLKECKNVSKKKYSCS